MTLYRETTCDHGYMVKHPLHNVFAVGCPGGSREEVTIDYEAALRMAREELELNIYEGEARAIVDAALHTEKEPASA